MSGRKIALIAVGVLMGSCYFWFKKNAGHVQEEAKVALKEGAQFGTGKGGRECLVETLRRLPPSVGIIKEAIDRSFLSGCIEAAAPAPELCAGAPPRSEIVNSAAWIVNKCGEFNRTDLVCKRTVGELHKGCVGS